MANARKTGALHKSASGFPQAHPPTAGAGRRSSRVGGSCCGSCQLQHFGAPACTLVPPDPLQKEVPPMLSVTTTAGAVDTGGVMRMRPLFGTPRACLGQGLKALGSYGRVQLNTLIAW